MHFRFGQPDDHRVIEAFCKKCSPDLAFWGDVKMLQLWRGVRHNFVRSIRELAPLRAEGFALILAQGGDRINATGTEGWSKTG